MLLMFSSLSSALSLVVAHDAYADSLDPVCDSGRIDGDGFSSSFNIMLSCKNIVSFASSGGSIADSLDLTGIKLQPITHSHNPISAEISGDQLTMKFYYSDGAVDRDVLINPGVLFNNVNGTGISNAEISITTDLIADYDIPYVTDDYYTVNSVRLEISAAAGVLTNDVDAEGPLVDCVVSANPQHGSITLNPDGSFVYARADGYYGDDQFSYFAIDGGGNSSSNEAFVYITDTAPEIVNARLSRQGSGNSAKARVGETLRVDLITSEKVTLTNMVIAGNSIADCQVVDDTHYYFTYVMREVDVEGPINFSLTAHDLSGKTKPYSSEEGSVIFNKTPPVITLHSDADLEISIHDTFTDDATAFDDIEGAVPLVKNGTVNSDISGYYTITYNAVDSFGNQAIMKTRNIHVVDYVNDEFVGLYQQLKEAGYDNNLNSVNIDNLESFSGLYVERVIGGVRVGRITFIDPVDLSNSDIIDFLLNINNYMTAEMFGKIGLDFSGTADDFPLRGKPAIVKFYHLDKLGYNLDSKSDDVYDRLNIFDDNNQPVNKDDMVNSHGQYVGCSSGGLDCYSFTIQIKHFTFFTIGEFIAPLINKPVFQNVALVNSMAVLGNSIATVKSVNNTSNDDWVASSSVDSSVDSKISDSQTPKDIVESKNDKSNNESKLNLQDIAWYWWLISVVVVGGAIWWVVGRRRDL